MNLRKYEIKYFKDGNICKTIKVCKQPKLFKALILSIKEIY